MPAGQRLRVVQLLKHYHMTGTVLAPGVHGRRYHVHAQPCQVALNACKAPTGLSGSLHRLHPRQCQAKRSYKMSAGFALMRLMVRAHVKTLPDLCHWHTPTLGSQGNK